MPSARSTSFRFYCNLAPETVPLRASLPMSSMLLSITSATAPLVREARAIKGRRGALLADNGNAGRIMALTREFEPQAARLRKATQEAPARASRQRARALAEAVRTRCLEVIGDVDLPKAVAAQHSLNPTAFIGHEDFTVQVLVALGIEPDLLALPTSWYVGQQLLGIEYAAATLAGRYGPTRGRPYTVLHAVDYASAYDAAFYAGADGATSAIATGVAGFMNDRAFVRSYEIGDATLAVAGGKAVPRRYLRTLQVVLGLRDGFRDARGVAPHVHALGLGAPIMLPLLALALDDVPDLSVDSTAPIKNANMNKIMLDDPAYMNGTIERIAGDVLTAGYRWTHRCAPCQEFLARHPFDYDGARAFHREVLKGRPLRAQDLEAPDGIGRFLPLLYNLTALKGSPLRRELFRARVGHNHAVMLDLAARLHRRRASPAALRTLALRLCDDYRRVAATEYPPYALQIDECLRLLAQATPGVARRGAARHAPPPTAPDRPHRASATALAGGHLATVGLEKIAIVATTLALQAPPTTRHAYAALGGAAWVAMTLTTPNGSATQLATRGALPTSRFSTPAVRALRAVGDVLRAEPATQPVASRVSDGVAALRIANAIATAREQVLALAEGLDGTAANLQLDRTTWEQAQAAAATTGLPRWFQDALEREGVAGPTVTAFTAWFAAYYRRRVKPQKASYLFRLAYHELRAAAVASHPT